MPEQPLNPADDEDRVNEVIAEYLSAVQSGTPPDREELLRKHSALAVQLEAFFADRDLFESVAAPLRAAVLSSSAPATPAADASTLAPGDTPPPSPIGTIRRFGDYVLEEEIARGGMGVVYRARQISLNRPVALKMILAGRLASADEVARFRNEAEAAAKLDHANIVPIYEVGEHEGQHYFSMKLVEGGDLTQHLPRLNQDPRAAARLVAEVAEAIHHAHQRGILHRDLKPRNILLDSHGQPQVTDFGLAKQVEGNQELTHSGAVLGTAPYMSPEQARGDKDLTTAADVYSLGTILYELLTGRPPLRGSSPAETILKVLEQEPERPRAISPHLGRDLETICLKCLEKDPRRRYGSAEAMAEELRRWLEGKPIAARPVGRIERLWRWCRRNPALAAVISAAAAVIVSLTALFSWRLIQENAGMRKALDEKQEALIQLDAERVEKSQAYDLAEDRLARSLYEQSRALRASGPPERRWRILELLEKAERLRSRPRETPPPALIDNVQFGTFLPTRAELRSEAVAALLLPGVRLLWKEKSSFGAQPGVSADGRLAAALWTSPDLTQRAVGLTDLQGHRELGRWENGLMLGTAFALHSDGRLLATVNLDSGVIALWDLPSGMLRATLQWPGPGDPSAPAAALPGMLLSSEMAFSPDGGHLVAIHRRSPLAQAELSAPPGGAGGGGKDGDRTAGGQAAAGQRQSVVLWDLRAPNEPRVLATMNEDFQRGGGIFSPNGKRLVLPSGDKSLTVWDVPAQRKSAEVELPLELAGRLTIDRASRRVACPCRAADPRQGTIVFWDLDRNAKHSEVQTSFPLAGCCTAFSPDGSLLAVGTTDGQIRLIDVAAGRMLIDLPEAHAAAVAILRWTASDRLLSWAVDGTFKQREVGESPLREIPAIAKTFRLAFSPDGKRLAVAREGSGSVWLVDPATGSPERTLEGDGLPTPGLLAFSRDGQQLAAVGAYHAVAWDASTGRRLACLDENSGLKGLIGSVARAADGSPLVVASSSSGPVTTVWDLLRSRRVWQPPSGAAWQTTCLAPGGRLLAAFQPAHSKAPGKMTVLELSSGRTLIETEPPGMPIGLEPFSPDGRWLATLRGEEPAGSFPGLGAAGDQTPVTEVVVQPFPSGGPGLKIAHSSPPSAFAFSADSRFLAVGYRDGSAQVWDLAAGEEVFRVGLRSRAIVQLAFSGDGSLLAATDGQSAVQLLDLSALRRQLTGIGLDW